MTQYWEPGTQYNDGAVVEYEGHRYKIIQPHRSQSDWAPPITPALWGRLSDNDNNNGGNNKQEHESQQYQQPPQQQHQDSFEDKVRRTYHDHENEAKIAGGVAAGAAILGAAGLAYKHHQDQGRSEQEEKRDQQHQQHQQDSFGDKVGQFFHDHEKEAKIGGGVLAGAALLGAAGLAYKHHQDQGRSEQEERRD